MGKTFVYNSGSASIEKGVLTVIHGVFFDGISNNQYHTEIRKKVQQKGEMVGVKASKSEQKIYKKYKKQDSFGNDFTNVARKYMCTERESYSIYIEGIGTVDRETKKKKDDGEGYKYGRGDTGIIEKVKSGCEKLADKIKNERNKNPNKRKLKKIILNVDAFGFSRGAAAARNFLYNLQKGEYVPRSYTPPVMYARSIEVDHDGYGIKKKWLKEGKLPKFGHLGTELLEAGIPRDLIDNMTLNVRFLGIYDTVASYDPECLIVPDFDEHYSELHLHDLGAPKKAVHFTAMDEHRGNFALTRLNIKGRKFSPVKLLTGIEHEFPGVHSDIGGSYENDTLSRAELNEIIAETGINPDPTVGITEFEHIIHERSEDEERLEMLRANLIKQGWYKNKQVSIAEPKFKRDYLEGFRYLYRGYSLIMLHFMSDYAVKELSNNLKHSKILSDYDLNDDFLYRVKDYLQENTINEGKKWLLKKELPLKEDDLIEEQKPNPPIEEIEEENIEYFELEGVTIIAYVSDTLLTKLRNKYLHRSARVNSLTDRFGHTPTYDRIRPEHN